MELVFDLLWVLIVLVAYGWWFAHQSRGGQNIKAKAAMRGEIFVLGLALVILFPSISLSDDLHAENAVMEESSRSVLKARQLTQKCLRAGKSLTPLTAIIRAGLSGAIGLVVSRVFPPEVPLIRSALVRPSQGRSPPFFAN
jgi:hypothetical protein